MSHDEEPDPFANPYKPELPQGMRLDGHEPGPLSPPVSRPVPVQAVSFGDDGHESETYPSPSAAAPAPLAYTHEESELLSPVQAAEPEAVPFDAEPAAPMDAVSFETNTAHAVFDEDAAPLVPESEPDAADPWAGLQNQYGGSFQERVKTPPMEVGQRRRGIPQGPREIVLDDEGDDFVAVSEPVQGAPSTPIGRRAQLNFNDDDGSGNYTNPAAPSGGLDEYILTASSRLAAA